MSGRQRALDSARSSIGTAVPCGKAIPKEPIKEFHKEHPKDWHKEPVKEFPKDPHKEWPKEHPKEWLKEPIKEHPKDLPFDGGKGLLGDLPPKNILDPPKGFFEPPIDFPPTGYPGGPIAPVGGGGGMPFVLGTPAAAFGRQQSAALANGYVQLLAQFARLYARGSLDAAGMAAWQEAIAAYHQVSGA